MSVEPVTLSKRVEVELNMEAMKGDEKVREEAAKTVGTKTEGRTGTLHQDKVAWAASMAFIVLLLGIMWIIGKARGWHAISPYVHEGQITNVTRFWEEPFFCNETSIVGRHGIDCTAKWYFWKLPLDAITPLSRATMWLLYSLHQIFIWGLMYWAQLEMSPARRDRKVPKYGGRMRWFNYALLSVNGGFHLLHLGQTHWTYDGISQDVSLVSSLSSVVMMISLIMLIEYRDRGIMFMWPNPRSDDRVAKKVRLNPRPINLVRKYHGYYFAWAVIYTFWYHPMENTWGHTLGFFHTAILLLQGSLIFTDMHLNKYWRLLNESWVFLHGGLVAVQVADPDKPQVQLWPMFFFGFGFLLAFTQVFILPFWRDISPYFRAIPPVAFTAIAVAVFHTTVEGGLSKIWMVINIPGIQYANTLLAWLTIYLFLKLEARFAPPRAGAPSSGMSVLYVTCVLAVYAVLIAGAVLANYVQVLFLVLMEVYALVFILAIGVTFMLHKRLLG